ncbi:MAG: ATP-binding protein [Planctomycetia bacterium]|nr:ATP-binding protein [Planctomycetia bacterium]
MEVTQKNEELDLEIQKLRKENQALHAQLQAAATMISLGELVSTTTHEFNNILTTILNYAKIGLRHSDASTREKAFNTILSAGNRAAKLTSSILGMSRNRSSGAEPTDLIQLTEDALLLLEREMNKYRISVEKEYGTNIPEVLINGNQILQVLLNLIINARQAMNTGGRLIIKINHDPETSFVDLVIRDFGTGIPKDILPHIFETFFSTKKTDESGKGGTGLGLSMCRDIIEKHHGKIRVDSTVGKGTAFTLKLPVAQNTPPVKTKTVFTDPQKEIPAKKTVKKAPKRQKKSEN